ncbi:unnamed protein product [Dracunculus medinensis]|uniref:BTB domain-containing protein n=1 Tax=Dracunculus medinensis TaxID=318479 RepID=A0A0N4U7S8_DRAME|nr:unnamed protein product [Dracunculus medinensis]
MSLLAQFCRQTHTERLEYCDGFISETQEYFFERSGRIFELVYDFLTTGHFHRQGEICHERLIKELDFWRIKKSFFAPCCMPLIDVSEDEEDGQNYIKSIEYGDQFEGVCWAAQRRKLWAFMEDPSTGTLAKAFAIISITMVMASVTGMILGSLPEFQTITHQDETNGRKETVFRTHSGLEYLELVCVIWFTVEYFARFLVCTTKNRFIREPLNVIDSHTVYFDIFKGLGAHTIGEFRGLAMVMRVVRIMRVARIFKLARYSSGLKSFGVTVKTSLAELSMLFLFLLTAIIFFSTLMYFAERDEPNTKFRSIAHAGWWCIVTMTTVGYGDYCPQTFAGKVIASFASISGVLVLAFPITMIVENFSRTYDTEKSEFKTVQRRRRLAKIYG